MPKIGATPFGYRSPSSSGSASCRRARRWCRSPSHPDAARALRRLPGISLDVEVACDGGRFRENLLFTHRGLSGPAILQISSYWDGAGAARRSTCCPASMRARGSRDARVDGATRQRCSRERLPRRFAQQWCAAHASTRPMRAARRARSSTRSQRALHDWRVLPSGTLGYNKAEVTLGGVDTRELSSKTMEATRVPGPVLHRRGRRRDRLARRLQLPVGVGVGARRGSVRLERISTRHTMRHDPLPHGAPDRSRRSRRHPARRRRGERFGGAKLLAACSAQRRTAGIGGALRTIRRRRACRNLPRAVPQVVAVVRPDDATLAAALARRRAHRPSATNADEGMGCEPRVRRRGDADASGLGRRACRHAVDRAVDDRARSPTRSRTGARRRAVHRGERGHPVGFGAELSPRLSALDRRRGRERVVAAHRRSARAHRRRRRRACCATSTGRPTSQRRRRRPSCGYAISRCPAATGRAAAARRALPSCASTRRAAPAPRAGGR